MTTYYLDATGGNDSNAGTSEGAAWQTLSKLNTEFGLGTFSGGDVISFKRGETWTHSGSTSRVYVRNVSGTGPGASLLMINAYGVGNKPRIQGGLTGYAILENNTVDYVAVANLEIGGGTQGIYVNGAGNLTFLYVDLDRHTTTTGVNVLVKSGDTILFEDCVVDNGGPASCIYLGQYNDLSYVPSNITIHGCTIKNAGGEGVDFKIGCDTVIIEDCIFEEAETDGCISLRGSNHIVRRNSFTNSSGNGRGVCAWLSSTDNCTIQDNVFDCSGEAMKLYGTNYTISGNKVSGGTYGLDLNGSSVDVTQNVFNGCTIGVYHNTGLSAQTGIALENNVFDGCTTGVYIACSTYTATHYHNSFINCTTNLRNNLSGTMTVTHKNNAYSAGAFTNFSGATGWTSDYNAYTSTFPTALQGANDVTGAPLLLGPDYVPTTGSPVIDEGATGLGITVDYYGETRDASPDIGACEFISGSGPPAVDGEITFEGNDLSEFDATTTDGGDLSAGAAAAMAGTSYGMLALIDDTTPIYGEVQSLGSKSRFRVRFYLDPNTLPMTSGNEFSIIEIFDSDGTSKVFRIFLNWNGSSYRLQAGARLDSTSEQWGSYGAISDAPHRVELDCGIATGAGANNGFFRVEVDGVLLVEETTLDNDTYDIDEFWIGAPYGIDAGTGTGTLYIDEIAWNFTGSEIGPPGAGGVVPVMMDSYMRRRT